MFKILTLFMILTTGLFAQEYPIKIALLKYSGGGDWYADPTALPNLIKFCNENMGTNINPMHDQVDVGSVQIFEYPYVHMTGHGNVVFSPAEVENLRLYLESGGFLHVDDNYGLDPFFRREIAKVFPDKSLVELPINHPIYNQIYYFPNGIPKIHEHDNKPPQGFGIFIKNRLVLYYSYETDLSDGWESPEVHNNSEETRLIALKMGANIIHYVFNN
ncbi:MAG: DUF4159 domain-containing protein [Salinivirgaceae bacterium]|nr:DUF4159 domain-containing protein [Salinivirgaceae bacterium]MDD4747309.1 DUF4159 domain-containing protein [Salinivirgaceae bacterium]MDY0281275.1 DUF4159 domain-containing protein [Salinivirgaceae bacterium]